MVRGGGSNERGAAMKPLERADYDDDPLKAYQADIYRELEWLRFKNHSKPGWTRITYKEIFGVWPEAWMASLTPAQARAELVRLIKRKNGAFKRGKERERNARAAVSGGTASATRAGHAGRGNGKVEGGTGEQNVPISAGDE